MHHMDKSIVRCIKITRGICYRRIYALMQKMFNFVQTWYFLLICFIAFSWHVLCIDPSRFYSNYTIMVTASVLKMFGLCAVDWKASFGHCSSHVRLVKHNTSSGPTQCSGLPSTISFPAMEDSAQTPQTIFQCGILGTCLNRLKMKLQKKAYDLN